MIKLPKKQRASSVLGLSLDGNRLEGVVLRRTNGSLVLQKTISASLSLDPLTNDPELVGREIQNQLEKAGIRERRCAVCVPLNWVLTLQTKLPDLPEADVSGFLQIEAERGFPYGPDALLICASRFRSPAGEQYATQMAVQRDHVSRLMTALKAARLKPVTFSLGLALQVACGGGVAALRMLEGALEAEGGKMRLQADVVAREIRITLGQLPGELRGATGRVKVFGQGDLAQELAEELRPRLEPMGLTVKLVASYSAADFGVELPADAAVSPAFSLAARHLVGRGLGLEFLPPKVKPWRQFTARYSSRKLVWAGATAASIAVLIAALFLIQQWQLSSLRSKWAVMAPTVGELDNLQQQIRKFRPWFDDSLRTLSILRRVTEAFPADGVVSAKTVEIRDLATVTCSGTARDSQALLKTLDQLRATKEVTDVKVDQIRGKSPLQFTFNFHWSEQGSNEH